MRTKRMYTRFTVFTLLLCAAQLVGCVPITAIDSRALPKLD